MSGADFQVSTEKLSPSILDVVTEKADTLWILSKRTLYVPVDTDRV